jgi:hypothetical protein
MRPSADNPEVELPVLPPGAATQISVELLLPGKHHEGAHSAQFEVVRKKKEIVNTHFELLV